jgi:hypothetical protein
MPPLATVPDAAEVVVMEGAFALDGFGAAQGGHHSGPPERHRVVLTAATTSSPPVRHESNAPEAGLSPRPRPPSHYATIFGSDHSGDL